MTLFPNGLYLDLEDYKYRNDPGLSNSKLSLMAKSPAHFLYYESRSTPETPAMVFGRNLHMAVLEPKRFERDVMMVNVKGRNTVTFKEAAVENAGKTLITSSEWEMINEISCVINKHSLAHELITNHYNLREASVFYDHLGVRMKSRFDVLNTEDGFALDLKTCESAAPHAFSSSISTYGYYRQASLYIESCAILGIPVKEFIFIAVEKTEPLGVGVYRIDKEWLEIGKREIRSLIEQYKLCRETRSWPSYTDDEVMVLECPRWLSKRDENRTMKLDAVELNIGAEWTN